MPFAPGTYSSGPVPAQQLNTDLYGTQAGGPSGVLFHARRPLLSQSVLAGGTAYAANAAQAIAGAGLEAYSVIDNTALFGAGADRPGTYATYTFTNTVPGSGGSAAAPGGWWLLWGFPRTAAVTAPPGGAGAGLEDNGAYVTGTLQYGTTLHDNGPWYLDLRQPGTATLQPAFWWLSSSVPAIAGSTADTSGGPSRHGALWTAVSTGGGTLSSVPVPVTSWGTVTSAALNTMGSCLTLLNSPPILRVSALSSQTLANATQTVIDFTAAPNADNYAGWSTASSAYTARLPGLYLFSPTLIYGPASTAGVRYAALQVTAGGTAVTHQGPVYAANAAGTGLTAAALARVLSLAAGDTVSAVGYQNSGGSLALYSAYSSRLIAAYMTPQAPAGSTVSWTAPVTGFRFGAGALSGTALAAALDGRLGNDVAFLLNRPYFTGWQASAQSGFADNSGFQQITIDTFGALPRGGNGDNRAGWSTASSWYASQLAGWYLIIADLYASPPAATTATLTAGIYVSSSGGITPAASPDWYQQVAYPVTTGGPPPGAFAMGLYYLKAGEYTYPALQAQGWGTTWGTYTGTAATSTIHSQFSVFWISE